LSRLEFLVLTCSWTTDRPPLVEAIAEVVKVLLVIKIDNVIAETMKNTCIWRQYPKNPWLAYGLWECNLRFL